MDQLVLLLTLCEQKPPSPNLKLPSFRTESEEKASLSLCQVGFLPQAKPSPRLIHSLHSFERKPPPHLLGIVFTHGLNRSLKKCQEINYSV